jgi:hypothetical protein
MYMAKYNEQLVAGNTKNLPNLGLRVSMPDYSSLTAKVSAVEPHSGDIESAAERVGVVSPNVAAKPGNLSLGGGERAVDRVRVLTEDRSPHLR